MVFEAPRRERLTHRGANKFEITLSGDGRVEYLRIYTDKGYADIPILSAKLYKSVLRILDGHLDEALSLIKDQYGGHSAWSFYSDCTKSISFETFADVLNILTGYSGSYDLTQFRAGIGYFAERILEPGPQNISSLNILNQRIEYWNSKSNLVKVELPEVIAEKLGRNWHREGIRSEREELRTIGFNPVEFDPSWDSPVPACWLAHLTLSEGIRTAEEYVRSRPVAKKEEYTSLKQSAINADEDRGVKWGAVVACSIDTAPDDFQYAAFNYLRHTAEEYRGKAKFTPLLYAGSKILIPDGIGPQLRQKINFGYYISIGHTWRRDNANNREIEAFEKAKSVARGSLRNGYTFNPFLFVEAESSLTHAVAKSKSSSESKCSIYQIGISNIREISNNHDIPNWKVKKEIGFLEKQMNEYAK